MLIEIKSWVNGKVIHTIEADSIKLAIEALARQGADLGEAYLRGADLRGAYLRGAYLRGAYLGGAYLRGADLRGADLRGAYLRGADLRGAYLRGAYLGGAYLRGAYLGGAEIDDLLCLSELSDAIELAPMIFQEWDAQGFDAVKKRFGLYQVAGEDKALIAMAPLLIGGFCFVLHRREIWWWSWQCPDPRTVPVLWRQAED